MSDTFAAGNHCRNVLRGARWLAAAFTLTLLGACSLLPIEPTPTLAATRQTLTDFSLVGRFALRQDDKNYSGRISWQHAGRNDDLLLSSPFGQGIAEIVSDENGARLTASDGRTYAAPDAETLTRQVLGYPLPLPRLTDWVRRRFDVSGDEGSADIVNLDQQGRPRQARHESWRVDYAYDDDDPVALPAAIFVEKLGGFELRLRIDEWNELSSSVGSAGPKEERARP